MGLGSSSDEFGTPDWLFELLHEEFDFTVDVCASDENWKLGRYYTKEDNALELDWCAHRVFCNPPYSNGMKEAFARKAYEETEKLCPLVVMILPTCTDQAWFHELVRAPRVLTYFVQGRIKFEGGAGSARDSHMILVFRNRSFCGWRKKK